MGFKRGLKEEAGQNLFPGAVVTGHHALNPHFLGSVDPEAFVPDFRKVRLVKGRGGFKDYNIG